MMYYTPIVLVPEKKKVKKEIPGPRAETLMLLRYFARTYDCSPESKQRASKRLLN